MTSGEQSPDLGQGGPGSVGTGSPPIYVPPTRTPVVYPPVRPGSPYPYQAYPPGVYQAGYPPGWLATPPPAPPKARHSAARWFVVAICLLFICAFGGAGAIVGVADITGLDRTVAAWRTPAAVIAAPPDANAPAAEWTDWARRALDSSLKDQAQALVAADESRFLAPVDPDNQQLVADMKRRYSVLTQMGVGQWTQILRAAPKPTGERTWDADIKISYCFGDPTCRTVGLVVSSEWEFKNDHLVMVGLEPSEPDQMGPRPWEVDDLTIGKGDRVVVAASKSNAWRVADAVTAADKAAKVADTLAKWESPPSRFVIFLAGPTDWAKWYGHEQPEWAAAWAVPVSPTVTEVVVRTQAVQQRGLEQLLTHELTHVTTLAGKRDGANRSAWWLIEGIADYATMIGRSIGEYDALAPTRSFVRGRWDGDPAVAPPTVDASLEEASARYGVAFLAVRRISDVYGQDKLLEFFGKIVHDNATADVASTQVLGADWATVKADCAQYIRTATR